MSDDATMTATTPSAESDAAPTVLRCPWCSEVLPAEPTARCPHCNASLEADGETRLPGLTEVEAPASAKARRADPVRRSKLLSWISGDLDDVSATSPLDQPSAPEALDPPARDVRREMLRLQLEAEGLVVAPDGTIEGPVAPADGAAPDMSTITSADAAPVATADADVMSDVDAPDEVRKAS